LTRFVSVFLWAGLFYGSALLSLGTQLIPLGNAARADSIIFHSIDKTNPKHVIARMESYLAQSPRTITQTPKSHPVPQDVARLEAYLAENRKSDAQTSKTHLAQNATKSEAKSTGSEKQATVQTVSQEDDLLSGPDFEKAISGDAATQQAGKDKAAAKPLSSAKKQEEARIPLNADKEHLRLFVENRYPSANACGVCHPKHYKEWSVSQHAYAQLSPIYLSLNNKINELSNGSNGDFCLRCHSPVGVWVIVRGL